MKDGKKVVFFTVNKNREIKACEYIFTKNKSQKEIKKFLENEIFDEKLEEKFYFM